MWKKLRQMGDDVSPMPDLPEKVSPTKTLTNTNMQCIEEEVPVQTASVPSEKIVKRKYWYYLVITCN